MSKKRDGHTLRAALDDILREIGPGQTIGVLVGAGVSLAAPANLPTAYEFKKALAEALLEFDESPDEIAALTAQLNDRKIPFEKLLQQIYDTMADTQPAIITEMLRSTYGVGKPNQNHKVLSEYLLKGRIQLLLTTNFDDLLEQAGKGLVEQVVSESQWQRLSSDMRRGKIQRPTVAHLHGSLNKPGSLVTLMNQVGRELHGPRKRVLDHLLTHGTLLFIGYSGSDEDINPILHLYPPERQWWLLRPGDLPDKPHKQQYRNVQLVPRRSEIRKDTFHALLDHLSQPELRNFTAAILISTGMYSPAIRRLARSLKQERTNSAMLAFAAALRDEQYFFKTDMLLEKAPPADWPYWPRWGDTRAFSRRHLGKFNEAVKEFEQLRMELEKQLSNLRQRNKLVSELMQITQHEIEVLLLIAPFKRRAVREGILTHCEELLEKCRTWLGNTRIFSPPFEIHYYAGEIALLRGDFEAARREYEIYEEKGSYWFGNDAVTLVCVRRAVVEAAAGNLQEALEFWRKGFQLAKSPAPFMVRIQYWIILPALFVAPLRGYWLTRIIAARLYGLYGRLKFAMLRIRHPRLYHEINQISQ